MRRYLANLHCPLLKFRSLGFTSTIYKTFPQGNMLLSRNTPFYR